MIRPNRPRELRVSVPKTPPRFARPAPKGKSGVCRGCGKPPGPGRRKWCSDGCWIDYNAKRSAVGLRKAVFTRDLGVCRTCRLDCTALAAKIRSWRRSSVAKQVAAAVMVKLGIVHRKTYWDADHIVPVSAGGGSCDVRNVQTLCLWCHKNKNAGGSKGSGVELVRPIINAAETEIALRRG